jgi:preprotein translocase subunit YajC
MNKQNINENDFVITSKGNYGRVISVGSSTAKVKIGYKIHEIELYNLNNVNDGTHVRVDYVESDTLIPKDIMIFLKHNEVLYDSLTSNILMLKVMDLVVKKIQKTVLIIKISIP